MAKKPIIFKPELHTPQGINNYTGEVFRCFTRGETLPFKFTFNTDITGWTLQIVITDVPAGDDELVADQTLLNVQIPVTDAPNGVFEGPVSAAETDTVPEGLCYAMAKYITAAGDTHIIDMCRLEVYPGLIFP